MAEPEKDRRSRAGPVAQFITPAAVRQSREDSADLIEV